MRLYGVIGTSGPLLLIAAILQTLFDYGVGFPESVLPSIASRSDAVVIKQFHCHALAFQRGGEILYG
jgi:hypothetical protein